MSEYDEWIDITTIEDHYRVQLNTRTNKQRHQLRIFGADSLEFDEWMEGPPPKEEPKK